MREHERKIAKMDEKRAREQEKMKNQIQLRLAAKRKNALEEKEHEIEEVKETEEEKFEEYLSTEKSKMQTEIEHKAQDEGILKTEKPEGPLSIEEIEKALQDLPLVGSLREIYNFLSKSFLDGNVEYSEIKEIPVRKSQ